MEYTILIVDDEATQRKVLSGFLKKQGYKIYEASSGNQAIEIASKNIIDLVITDFKMPDISGIEVLKLVRSINPEIAVIIMTAFGTIETAVEAMREGAYNYLTKPINLDELELLINRTFERQRLVSENKLLKEQLIERLTFPGIVSQSAAMENVLNTASRVARSKASVLIRGESGTGKELIAKAIHFNSQRKEKPFIAVNCAALNENLLESELFGHEKGAFTGADKQRRGRFELADGGTIFLDEIGDIPLATQVKLLRVLQEQQFERVGGSETIKVDVRIIAATNRNLEDLIKAGTFREDLYYRLNVVTIDIPPLRNRREDIPALLEYFLKKFASEQKRDNIAFSKEAWELLLRYNYPGNIRELENIVQRAVILSRQNLITTNELPQVVKEFQKEGDLQKPEMLTSLPAQVEKLEKELIFEALRLTNGNQSKAAEMLGISERNLRYKLKKWGVK
ncbi:MAG: Response regulator of zinc sigma-54-dependent two-component system [Ignavibacteriae bacterium]|nr:MAG: Response regulator of zinc sigma-54-dependent two-component system [Ignavibacteriota bacterium]